MANYVLNVLTFLLKGTYFPPPFLNEGQEDCNTFLKLSGNNSGKIIRKVKHWVTYIVAIIKEVF